MGSKKRREKTGNVSESLSGVKGERRSLVPGGAIGVKLPGPAEESKNAHSIGTTSLN